MRRILLCQENRNGPSIIDSSIYEIFTTLYLSGFFFVVLESSSSLAPAPVDFLFFVSQLRPQAVSVLRLSREHKQYTFFKFSRHTRTGSGVSFVAAPL